MEMTEQYRDGLSARECRTAAREVIDNALGDQKPWMVVVYTWNAETRTVNMRRVSQEFPVGEYGNCQKLLAKDMAKGIQVVEEPPIDDSPLKLAAGFEDPEEEDLIDVEEENIVE